MARRSECRVLTEAPVELTDGSLHRLGEGIGKIAYASEHWVVFRERSPLEMVALIILWKALRKLESLLPGAWGKRLRDRPSRQIRFLRVLTQGAMLILPRALWFSTHIRDMFRLYHRRSVRGEKLAQAHLTGSDLIPERIEFPPARVHIGGWPGWLVVCEAAERVETTLYHKMVHLAAEDRFTELEIWLDRLIERRQDGWRRGLFSLDAHLKNYGAIGERVVLLDTGGLTNRWAEVERKLEAEASLAPPHVRLGLGELLAEHAEIADRFDQRWNAAINPAEVRACWPGE